MFSAIIPNQNPEIINLEQLSKNFENRGFTFIKPKRDELESGLSTSSFMVKKNGQTLIIFVMKLSPNSFICTGYNKCKMISEKQLRYQSEIIDFVDQMAKNTMQSKNEELNRIDVYIEKIKNVAVKTEKNFKDQISFSQEMKISDEYAEFLNYQKKIYEKIIADSQFIIDNKRKIKDKNRELLDSLLKAEDSKQSLQNVILAYEEQKNYLNNPKRIIEEKIEQKKKSIGELNAYTLNETFFDDYIKDLIELEQLKIRLKALAQ